MDRIRELPALHFPHSPDFPELLMLARASHGRVREEAVSRLGVLRRADALPFLIERLNDWVPQVRNAARAAIEPLFTEEYARAFVQCLAQLQQLRRCARDNHEIFIARVEAFLADAPQRRHVLEGVRSPDRRLAGLCLQIVVEYALVDDAERVELGLLHGDIAFARDAVAHIATLPTAQRCVFAERALAHALAPVRRDAFRLLLADGIAQERIEAFAFDRHAAVRALAVRHLRNIGVDIAARYRAELASTNLRRRRIAIEGVAALGTIDEVRALRSLLTDPSPTIRRCALVAWTLKHRLDAVDDVVAAMSDPAPSVARQAADLAEIVRPQLDADTMLGLIENPAWTDNDGPLLAAFGCSDKWELLIFVLQRLIQTRYPPERAASLLRYWETRTAGSSVQPQPAQIARMQHLVDRFGAELLVPLRGARFDFFLRTLGIECAEPVAPQREAQEPGVPSPSKEAPAQRPGLVPRIMAWWRQS